MEKEEYDIPRILSNNKELTEKDILTLLVLMKQGRITNPQLLEELNLKGANLSDPNSAAHYRKKLEKLGVVEGYHAKINWTKVGYPTEFIAVATSNKNDILLDIERGHIAAVKEYRKETGSSMLVIPVGDNGEKVILKDVIFGGEKPIAVITGIATDDWAATAYANFYLPKRYPGIDVLMLLVKRSGIREFEFQDKFLESIIPVLFKGKEELEECMAMFKKGFRWDLLKHTEK
ncbi:hypothetical protein BEH94_02755 [Candidatus Altiarchaeales archaeon WOR_SM1_SCG]|nr:hypothetical protein BEH94_02755 [Candidatus Altiarchaeales archaeon WOR_SM1_SCG]